MPFSLFFHQHSTVYLPHCTTAVVLCTINHLKIVVSATIVHWIMSAASGYFAVGIIRGTTAYFCSFTVDDEVCVCVCAAQIKLQGSSKCLFRVSKKRTTLVLNSFTSSWYKSKD